MYSQAATAAQLRDEYITNIRLMENHIEKLKQLIRQKPPHIELSSLEQRLELCRLERRELSAAADRLTKEAAPPPPSPSYAARCRS